MIDISGVSMITIKTKIMTHPHKNKSLNMKKLNQLTSSLPNINKYPHIYIYIYIYIYIS